MSDFDFWRFLAGIGIFIFAMYLMEESIRELSGRAFKAWLRKYTGTRLRALLTGTLSTAILQSSSAVSLMLLAFVGAGLMTMPNAIGVILGSNLGTTLTAWIVATLGFKVEIESIALPLLGIGGLGIIFLGKSEKYSNLSKLIVGFGFLFLGLEHMKGSIEAIAGQMDMANYADLNSFIYLLLGIVLTALMQSSSATLAVVLTALYAQIIPFEMAAVIVIGSNIGTTVTILLGALGGGRIKWRVALSHVIFNVITGGVALLALPLLLMAVDVFLSAEREPVLALALFHTFFNVLGVLLFFPFVGLLARGIMRWLPDLKHTVSRYVSHTTAEVVEPAITAIQKETDHLLDRCLRHNLQILHIDRTLIWAEDPDHASQKGSSISKQYESAKLLQAQIFKFSADVQTHEMTKEESEQIGHILHSARLVLHSAKIFKDIQHNFENFEQSDNPFLRKAYADFRKRFVDLSMQLAHHREEGEIIDASLAHERMMATVKRKDEAFIRSVSRAVGKESQWSDMDISTAIIVNRSFIYASQHLINAWYELQGSRVEE